ncbi:MAG: pyruvate kinase [Oligoflexales bacterium]
MIQKLKRRTKIVLSIDKPSEWGELTEKILDLAPSAVRIPYSFEETAQILQFLERIQKTNHGLSVLLDISSYHQAVLLLKEARDVKHGEKLTITTSQTTKAGDLLVSAGPDHVWEEKADIFLGFGNVILTIDKVEKDQIFTTVLQSGTLRPNMDCRIPKTYSSPSSSDLKDINLAQFIKKGVDHIIIPGDFDVQDIQDFRNHIYEQSQQKPWLIGKIATHDHVEQLSTTLKTLDGVLISRRELALSVDPAVVPMITKELVQSCSEKTKFVLVASDTLASMQTAPTPTRAEVSDVANSVLDGVDAIVLSEDLSRGPYFERALQVCCNIVEDIEKNEDVQANWAKRHPTLQSEYDSISWHAFKTAERIQADAIVCLTEKGNTALSLSSFRPSLPVLAVSYHERIAQRMNLLHGVHGITLDRHPTLDDILPLLNDRLTKSSWLKSGDTIVLVTVSLSPIGDEASNLFTIQRLS